MRIELRNGMRIVSDAVEISVLPSYLQAFNLIDGQDVTASALDAISLVLSKRRLVH